MSSDLMADRTSPVRDVKAWKIQALQRLESLKILVSAAALLSDFALHIAPLQPRPFCHELRYGIH